MVLLCRQEDLSNQYLTQKSAREYQRDRYMNQVFSGIFQKLVSHEKEYSNSAKNRTAKEAAETVQDLANYLIPTFVPHNVLPEQDLEKYTHNYLINNPQNLRILLLETKYYKQENTPFENLFKDYNENRIPLKLDANLNEPVNNVEKSKPIQPNEAPVINNLLK